MSEVLNLLPRFKIFARALRADRDIVLEAADFVADLGGKSRTSRGVSNVVDNINVAGVIDEAPAGTIEDRTAADYGRIAVVREAVAVEVDGVSSAHVGARSGHKLPVLVHFRIVDRLQLVRSPQLVEASVSNVHIAVVHEHDMPSPLSYRGLRFDYRVAGRINHMHIQIVRWRRVRIRQRLVEIHDGSRNALDRRTSF